MDSIKQGCITMVLKKKSGSQIPPDHYFSKSAQERTRTFTSVRSLHPECSASTNSATWAKTPFKKQCPGQDSNLHTVTGASPSSWCVYQFHHLGKKLCKSNTLFYSASIFQKKAVSNFDAVTSNYMPIGTYFLSDRLKAKKQTMLLFIAWKNIDFEPNKHGLRLQHFLSRLCSYVGQQ